MEPFYQIFTFGAGQKYENCYVKIYGKDANDCRNQMFQKFGKKWSMQYDTKEQAGVEKYNLKEISLPSNDYEEFTLKKQMEFVKEIQRQIEEKFPAVYKHEDLKEKFDAVVDSLWRLDELNN